MTEKKKQNAAVCATDAGRGNAGPVADSPRKYSRAGRVNRAVLCVVLLFLAGCTSPGEIEEGKTEIQVSEDLQKVTVRARSVSRASILETLRVKYSIEIRPQDLEDETVTVDMANVPLEEAIEKLLPEGTRYIVRTGDREWAVPAVSKQQKKGQPIEPSRDLPTKGKTTPLPDDRRVHVKVEPDRWKPPRPRYTRELKPDPVKVTRVPPGKGPKRDKPEPVPTAPQLIRLRFHISSDNTVRLQHAARMAGTLPQSTVVRGSFLFALRESDGTVVHFGSFTDPLEMHGYNEDGTHNVMRAKEGSFGLWIPDSPTLSNLNLEFYDARNVTLPTELDRKSFTELARKAKSVARVEGKVLSSSINRS